MAALLGLSACSGSSSSPATPPSASATPTASSADRAPRVAEVFTPLPCQPNTTIGMEGCAEHRVLRADVVINRDLAALWRRASNPAARQHLVDAQTAWVAYRKATCISEGDAFDGGSLSIVISARCLARITEIHAHDLTRQRQSGP